MILIFGTGEGMQALPKEQRREEMAKWFAWDKELRDKGQHVAGEALSPQAKVIGGKSKRVESGFFSPSKDYVIGGYYVVWASGMDEAVAIAKGCPTFGMDGTVEVREVMTF